MRYQAITLPVFAEVPYLIDVEDSHADVSDDPIDQGDEHNASTKKTWLLLV